MPISRRNEEVGFEYEVLEKFKDKDNKTIVISFDGTGGEPGWAVQDQNDEDAKDRYKGKGGLSNVCKMHLYAGGNVGNTYSHFDDQVALYYSGVGTRGTFQFAKSALGLGAMEDIYTMAYEDLGKIYKEGDKLFVFGFSRGAATSRLFCSFLKNNPIGGVVVQVAFLGVYDTVAESFPIFGGVGTNDSPATLDYGTKEEKRGVLADNVAKAVHLVSLDEDRSPFTPTLMNEDPRVTEVWVPGCHSDAGGGYYHDGLSDIALTFMKKKAVEAGLQCREITKETCEKEPDTLIHPEHTAKEQFTYFDNDMKIDPDPLDRDIHNQMSAMYHTLNFVTQTPHRYPSRWKDNLPLKGEPILLLDAVIERAKDWEGLVEEEVPKDFEIPEQTYKDNKYRPSYLVDVPYKLVSRKDMSVSETVVNSITDVVDDW